MTHPKSYWNYRKITDGKTWWIGEVYYTNKVATHATDGLGTVTDWETEDELDNTVMGIARALVKPPLEVNEDGELREME